jgi:hypothetical protein
MYEVAISQNQAVREQPTLIGTARLTIETGKHHSGSS